jgi:hypothetical protein
VVTVRIFRPALVEPKQAIDSTRRSEPYQSEQLDFSSIYLATIGATAIVLIVLFGASLAVINRFGFLPPPQLSNNLCMDEKLAHLREHPIDQPTILTVGSSVAWRSVDSGVVREASDGQGMPLNGAFCGLKMNQTEFTALYLLGHYPSVRFVVLILAPPDLTQCSTANPDVFRPQDVDNFVFRREMAFGFYLKYFDPLTLAKNAMILRSMRNGALPLDAMTMDRYGDAPLDTDMSRNDLVYDGPDPLDPVCLSSLSKFAHDIEAQDRHLIVVMMPLSPVWKASYDPTGEIVQDLTRQIQSAITVADTIFWDANRDFPMDPSAFVDAIHIRWSAAKIVSRARVLATGLGSPGGTLRD